MLRPSSRCGPGSLRPHLCMSLLRTETEGVLAACAISGDDDDGDDDDGDNGDGDDGFYYCHLMSSNVI